MAGMFFITFFLLVCLKIKILENIYKIFLSASKSDNGLVGCIECCALRVTTLIRELGWGGWMVSRAKLKLIPLFIIYFQHEIIIRKNKHEKMENWSS